MYKSSIVYAFSLMVILFCWSCKKLVTVDFPPTSLSGENIYSNDATAPSLLTGIYTSMSSASLSSGDLPCLGFITGLTGDELKLYSGLLDIRLQSYYLNQISPIDRNNFWFTLYPRLYGINTAIEKTSQPNGSSESIRLQVLGEAKFMRAFIYMTLVNLYGDVPLVISSNYIENKGLARAPAESVWKQIILDLIDAQNLLSSDYLDGKLVNKTQERLRPTKWAASALLARAYLYLKDWKNAEIQATNVINQADKYKLVALSDVFQKNSKEAIWQLQPVLAGRNTEDARSYIITSDGGPNAAMGVYLSDQLINSFEKGDNRKTNWIDTVTFQDAVYYFAYKYKIYLSGSPVTEYNTVLRLSEQYLIRAESRANLNNIDGAREDISIVRVRAGLPNTDANTKDELLVSIMHERQVELFTEWGHRWFDLKRTGKIDPIMSKVSSSKGAIWNTNWQLFPIPFIELQADVNLKQNSGYSTP